MSCYLKAAPWIPKAGPRTNRDCAVLDVNGAVIADLSAAGNVISRPEGMVYGDTGSTLGPAIVFGYAAGLHPASR